MHANVHPLSSLGAVCVNRISRQEYSVLNRKAGAYPLPNSICRPPMTVFVAQFVGSKYFLGTFQQDLRRDIRPFDLYQI